MISEISGIPQVVEESSYVEKTEDTMGRDDFLKMFLAQLNHQDPLNPMDSTEFSSQLAQFSSLEQLFNVNENLESMKEVQDSTGRFQALELIGKEIEVEGDTLALEPGSLCSGAFTIDTPADCFVLIYDQNGYPVQEIQMGDLDSGEHSFDWDGRDIDREMMPEGMYAFEIVAIDEYGETIPVETRLKGLVNKVSLEGDQPLLYIIGKSAITLSQVLGVELSETQTE